MLADRAYGARSIREYISEHGANYVISPQNNVSNPWLVDWYLYKERHLIECFFQKIKWFRRIAARYDKLDTSFLAFVYLEIIRHEDLGDTAEILICIDMTGKPRPPVLYPQRPLCRYI